MGKKRLYLPSKKSSRPVFSLPLNTNGVANLDPSLNINGSVVTPTFRYTAADIDMDTDEWAPWGYGETLPIIEGYDPTKMGSPFLGTKDNSITNARYKKEDATFGDIDTEDVVFELIIKYKDGGSYASKYYYNEAGYLFYTTSGYFALRLLQQGIIAANIQAGVGYLKENRWYHLMYFLHRDGSVSIYVDGSYMNSMDISASDSLSNIAGNRQLWIGAGEGTGNLAYMAMWKQDDWLGGHRHDDLVAERFHRLCGTYPSIAKGTALPTSYTRASAAYSDKVEYDEHTIATNLSNWSKQNLTITDSGLVDPFGNTAYLAHENDVSNIHRAYRSNLTNIAENEVIEVSVNAKTINRDNLSIQLYSTSPAFNINVSFTVTTLGSSSSGMEEHGVEDLGEGWYRCWCRYRPSAVTANFNMYVYPGGIASYQGLDQDTMYLSNPTVAGFERKLHRVGNNFPRLVYRKDDNGLDVKGYLAEQEIDNICLYSEDLTDSTWSPIGASAAASAEYSPEANTLADDILETSGLSFSAPFSTNGVSELDQSLTINSTAVAPTFVYYGGAANATNWTAEVGETLTAAGSGGSFNQGSPFLGTDDDSVNPDGTRYWDAGNGSFADVTTEDIVFETVFFFDKSSGDPRLFAKINKYQLLIDTSESTLFFGHNDGTVSSTISDALTDKMWYHAMIFCDRSGNTQIYVNGVASGSAVASRPGTLTTASVFQMAKGSAGTVYDGNIAYAAMWMSADWLDTHLQSDVALERFYKLCGLYPEVANGTAIPTSYTRASSAYIDKVEYGDEKMPSVDPTSGWSYGNSSVASGGDGTHPNGATEYTASEDDTAADTHIFFEVTNAISESSIVEASIDVKAHNRSWLRWGFSTNGTSMSADSYMDFDLTNGVVGTGDGNTKIDYGIESLGSDWYRCWVRDITESTGTAWAVGLIGEADNDITFDGLDQESLYIANPSVKPVERKLYKMSSGMPRVVYRKDDTGLDVRGYLAEEEVVNLLPDSETLTGWNNVRCTVSGNMETAPDGNDTADGLYEDGSADTSHYVTYTATISVTSGTKYVFSAWLKAVNRDWVRFYWNGAVMGGSKAFYDLGSGTVEFTDGLAEAGIEDWGNGWFRCWSSTIASSDGTPTPEIYIGEADADVIFSGSSQLSMYVWGVQVEAGVEYPTSYIYTSGGTATREQDLLYYKGDDGNLGGVGSNLRGTVEYKLLPPGSDVDTNFMPLVLSDGGTVNNRIQTTIDPGGTFRTYMKTGGAEQTNILDASVDVFDGEQHTFRTSWKTDAINQYVDGSADGTADTSCTAPDDLDRIHISHYVTGGGQPNGIISDLKLYTSDSDPTDDSEHGIMQPIALTSGDKYVFSAWIKAGTRSWAALSVEGECSQTYFNLSKGSVGTESGDVTESGAEAWGDGWYRCWISFTASATATVNFIIQAANADEDVDYVATEDDVALSVYGVQVEAEVDYPTSYILTTSASATREADVLYFKGDDGNIGGIGSNLRGTMEAKILLPDVDNTNLLHYLHLSDGGDFNDRTGLGTALTDTALATIKTEGVLQVNTSNTLTDIYDGVQHTTRLLWANNNSKIYVDGSQEDSTDTTCTMPDELDRIHVGSYSTDDYQINGVVSDIKLWKKLKGV